MSSPDPAGGDEATRAALASSARGRRLASSGNTALLPVVRFSLASTFNIDPVTPLLRAACEAIGMWAEIAVAPFGQISAALLNPDDAPSRTDADVVVLIVSSEDDLSAFFQRPASFDDEAAEALVDSRIGMLSACVSTVAARARAVFVVAVPAERGPAITGLRPAGRRRRRDVEDRYVAGILALDALAPNIVSIDWWRELVAGGVEPTRDSRLWYLARMRLDLRGLSRLADLMARHARTVVRPAAKVVAVDLDDTLWGGVLDEVGVGGLDLGDEGVGLAFTDVQRELLKLHDAGVALVLCSKNDEATALAAIESRAGMVLARRHFAGVRIDWRDKATMLQELARELGFGLDSFVFLDDNPVERDWVRRSLPEVLVPELPRDPVYRPAFVATLGAFDRMELTGEDARRERSREASRQRDAHARSAADYDGFLASLGQQIDIARVREATIPRAAQLSERTNQFNLAPKAYSAGEFARLQRDPGVEMYTASVRDRFDDSGITGLVILRFEDDAAVLDAFLLSCRVLGRRIEDGLLAFAASRASARGAAELRAPYVATARNDAVRGFLIRRGLVHDEAATGPASVFRTALADHPAAAEWPSHLELTGEFVS